MKLEKANSRRSNLRVGDLEAPGWCSPEQVLYQQQSKDGLKTIFSPVDILYINTFPNHFILDFGLTDLVPLTTRTSYNPDKVIHSKSIY